MTQKKKNNIIIGSLCAVVLLMVVGYAAFQSVLNITGTSKVSSNWNILITDITTKNIVGGASNAEEPTGKGTLTATFNTNLVSPGDSIEYDITVSNQGTLNAVLSKINVTDSNNPAIKFTTSGLTQGDALNAGETAILTVKVEYDNNVTSQPNNLKSELTVTLDYVQNDGTSVTPTKNVVYRWTTDSLNIGDSIEGIETENSLDMIFSSKYYLFAIKHTVVNNIIESSEVCFPLDNMEHCLKPNEYETTKAYLLKIFGEHTSDQDETCSVSDSRIKCNYNGISSSVYAFSDGTVASTYYNARCEIASSGSSKCKENSA